MLRILSFSRTGTELNRTLHKLFISADCAGYAPERMIDPDGDELCALPKEIPVWIAALWGKDDFLFIGAAGIAVRMIALSVKDKYTDSAVLVMDEKARYVIPLLSGHVGGAISIAEQIAACTGAIPVITTATDVQKKFAVDVFARDHHLKITDRSKAKQISAAILEGTCVGVYAEPGYPMLQKEICQAVERYAELQLCADREELEDYEYGILIGETISAETDHVLVLLTGRVVAGIGCRRGIDAERLEQGLLQTLGRQGLDQTRLEAIVSIDLKAEEPGLITLAGKWSIPFVTYSAGQLQSTGEASSSSSFVQQVTGVDNVCERAVKYYLRDDAEGELIQKKQCLNGMTAALGIRYEPVAHFRRK